MIIQAIDKYLKERPRDEREIRCFHPSTLHRSASYLYRTYLDGDDQSFNTRTLRVFDNGHHVHQRLQDYLQKIGILKQAEVPIENQEYEIKGHADGFVEIAGLEGVLEIKSMKAQAFYACHEPKTEHLIQLNVYMFCTAIPRGVLLYENKDTQELKEFYVKQDAVILNPVLEKIRHVQNCIKQGREPLGRNPFDL